MLPVEVLTLAVVHSQRLPPKLDVKSLLVEFIGQLLDGVAREGVFPRLPIAEIIEPAVIERGPLDAKLLQLGDGSQHLGASNVLLIAPAAPVDVVRVLARARDVPALALQHTRIGPQRLVEVALVDRDETLWQ